ncbi:MAG TPA: SDR family oxidoreductase [Acidimicrobiales bacterium]|jgi:NAD(P)-dependent dehydrogenase (short-subunit alcohol dehydrogenase family)|nr:SDR family oxidoreductase [Acidimicrobiales bacterium]
MSVAVVTGASRGLGRALAVGLARQGWSLVVDARGGDALACAAGEIRAALTAGADVVALAGDVTDPAHRAEVVASAERLGGLDLVVNNASVLGPSPQPALASYPLEELRRVYEVNVVAPVALAQAALPLLGHAADPRVLNVTSDASVEAYEGWGGYGSSKAALDHASAVLAVEQPAVRVWVVDPGDMRTQMHQEAFPGEDISDRPPPEAVVPVLLELISSSRPSGRYRASGLGAAS